MLRSTDYQLLIATSILVAVGILIHYSLSPGLIYYHLVYVCIGVIVAFLFSKIDLTILRSFTNHMYIVSILLLLATLFLGAITRGSRRWIDFGLFQFQPSELMKLMLILILSQWLQSLKPTRVLNVIKVLALISVPMGLVLVEPDLGTTIILAVVTLTLLFVSGLPWKYIISVSIIGIALSPLLWTGLQDYQKDRIVTFMQPSRDPLGKGYNAIQSQIAVGSGQLIGRGLGHGTQSKLRFLPEYRTDFVFASLAEELGLIGSLLVIGGFSWLLIRLLLLAWMVESEYNRLVIIGVWAMFAFQMFVNIGMNIGIMPITGITLPFISSGGTSLIISLAAIGLVAGIAKKSHKGQGIEISARNK